MDAYYDRIFEIKNGKWLQIAIGEYGAEDNSNVQVDENDEPIYVYKWNGKRVEKEEYMKNVKKIIDKGIAKTITYDGASEEAIVKEIKDYER